MKRTLYYVIGIIACCCFWGIFTYTIGFLLNLIIPNSIDSGKEGPILKSLVINSLLLSTFGIQHSVMAREGFKRFWTKFIPEPLERSVYAISASAVLWFIMLNWQPMTGLIWDFQNIFLKLACYALFIIGGFMTIHSMFALDHFDYVGLRQIHLYFNTNGYIPLEFKSPAIYKYIRHPMTIGVLICFWATPKMTIGHLLFASGMTIYSIIGLKLEERDLILRFGNKYEIYKENVGVVLPKKNRS